MTTDNTTRHPDDFRTRHPDDVHARHSDDFHARHPGDVQARHPGDVQARHPGDVQAGIDLSSNEHLECPHGRLQELRETTPIFRNDQDGAWIVTRQADIVALLMEARLTPDIRHSADWHLGGADCSPEGAGGSLENAAPDSLFMQFVANNVFAKTGREHHQLRKFASQGFSRRVLSKIESRLTVIVDTEFQAIKDREEIDFSTEISQVLPTVVIGTLLNLPQEQWDLFTQLSADILINYVPMGSIEEKLAAVERYNRNAAEFKAIVDQRRGAIDDDDFLSLLLRAEAEGEKITTEEALSLIISLVMGAADTITDFVNQALLMLLLHPQQRALALASEAGLDNAIMETARHHYFVRYGHNRYAVQDFDYKGHRIRKGDAVRLMFDSAGRDADVYERPDNFDVVRDQKHNIAFGYGRHFCPGAALAKMQTRIIIKRFFHYFPDATVSGSLSYDVFKNTRRYQNIPIRLQP